MSANIEPSIETPIADPHSPSEPHNSAGAVSADLDGKHVVKRVVTLGSVRHRHEHTGEIILIPTPSSDPNDPLNWYDVSS
jgi:hypothetical protein